MIILTTITILLSFTLLLSLVQIHRLRRKQEKDMTVLAALHAELANRDAQLAALQAELASRDAQLTALHAVLAQKEAELQKSETELVPQPPMPLPDRSAAYSALRSLLIRKMECSQLLQELRGEKKGTLLTAEDWQDIRTLLDESDGRFVSRLQEQFPSLSDKDLQLMMFLRLRIPSKNLAAIYAINEKSVKQKLFLYKSKVGLDSESLSLRDFIETF